MSSFKFFSFFVALFVLQGCGFQPLYGGSKQAASPEFTRIKVESIPDRIGQLLHNHLLSALNPKGRPLKPLYVLNTKLTEGSTSLAVRKGAFATRANLTVSANFILINALNGQSLYSGKSALTVSYNILDDQYATVASQADAEDRAIRQIGEQIKTRLAVYFHGRLGPQEIAADPR